MTQGFLIVVITTCDLNTRIFKPIILVAIPDQVISKGELICLSMISQGKENVTAFMGAKSADDGNDTLIARYSGLYGCRFDEVVVMRFYRDRQPREFRGINFQC